MHRVKKNTTDLFGLLLVFNSIRKENGKEKKRFSLFHTQKAKCTQCVHHRLFNLANVYQWNVQNKLTVKWMMCVFRVKS